MRILYFIILNVERVGMFFKKILKLSLLSFVFCISKNIEASVLQEAIQNAQQEILRIDKSSTYQSSLRAMEYDNPRQQIIAAMQGQKDWQVKADSCCYYFCLPLVAVTSVITLDTHHTLLQNCSRAICTRTISHAQSLLDLEKKNQ